MTIAFLLTIYGSWLVTSGGCGRKTSDTSYQIPMYQIWYYQIWWDIGTRYVMIMRLQIWMAKADAKGDFESCRFEFLLSNK